MKDNEMTPFEGKEIRKIWYNEQWFFSVVDVIEVLTDSKNPSVYWSALKKREIESFTFCKRFNLLRANGKKYPTDCANVEGIFRILMSVPSPKVEPLKLWLAEQGKRAIDETENPELIYDRMTEIYKAKGRTEKWIKERLQNIRTRNKLTDEWKARDVKEGKEYSILTATIAKGTFGLTPSEHAQFKGLGKQNLRDHMTDLELILTSLSEEVTRTLTVEQNAKGFNENLEAAAKGGEVAGKARRNVEEATGKKIVSSQNFLNMNNDRSNELPEGDKTE